jgi:alpha-glucosidase
MGLRPEQIDLHAFVPADDGVFESILHEDDGLTFARDDGAFVRTRLTLQREASAISLRGVRDGDGFPEFARTRLRIVWHGLPAAESRIDMLENRGEDFAIHVP